MESVGSWPSAFAVTGPLLLVLLVAAPALALNAAAGGLGKLHLYTSARLLASSCSWSLRLSVASRVLGARS